MSLRVWLPLTGTLENKGCSNITVTNNGATINTNGKIGSCYDFSSSAWQRIVFPYNLSNATEFSICLWYKPISTSISGALFTFSRTSGNYWQFAIYQNNLTLRDSSTGVTGTRKNYSLGTFIANQWVHLTFTYNKGIINIYKDGSLFSTNNTGGTSMCSYDGTTAGIGETLTNSSSYYIGGSINDFRIYDHALSAAEVKEISQGLVLHYKLDASGGGFANSNLLTGNVNEVSTWVLNQATATNNDGGIRVQITSDTGDRRIYRAVTNVWTPANSTFTVSFEAKAATNNITLNVSRSNIATDMINFSLTTEWKHYSGQIVNTAAVDGGTLSIRCVTNGAIFWVKNVKLERGEIETRFLPSTESSAIIQDSSGYGYNGTINGTLTLSNDTPRYSACAVFNGTDTRIKVPNLTPDAITVSFWMKRNANTGTRQFLYTSWYGVTCELTTNGTTRFAVNKSSYPTISGSTITTSTGWIHYCGTFDTTNGLRLYENGVLKSSNTSNLNAISWSISTNYIGYYNTYYNGLMSDFRIYCTALSAEDIQSLYNTSAKIDNLQNIHIFELIENQPSIKITKTGQLKCKELTETTKASLRADEDVYANNIIER